MGTRGPAKKPRSLIENKGGRVRADRHPAAETTMLPSIGGKLEKLAVPVKPPVHLSSGAKKIWKEISEFLHENGLSHAIFNGSLEIYCKYLDIFREKSKYLKQPGIGDVYSLDTKDGEKWLPRPEVKIMDDAAKQVRGVATQFGLTPSSISQIQIKTGAAEEESPWKRASQS
jgi:P27 family predicted phage terminase small subunit